ncbi:patatin-like phospholipase family protein [Nocardia otitidiscaviarum]|uniref:patatin-like phospholipase family protein n=1 Tax=Nocardia otitidiscaviarum TaxID=1823 RepID=UPI0024557361|nr:patatin-like phospholipase family protein [Nocardia otitidiscaviarum]
MAGPVSPKGSRIALVLGGGGPVGISWLAGLAVGLREAGIDLGLADRFVGTSAGAVVGTVLAAGADPIRLLTPPSADAPPLRADPARLGEIFATMTEPGIAPKDARRKIGALAMAADVGAPGAHIDRMRALVGIDDWPDRDIVLTAIDAHSGDLRTWTPGGAATLAEALAATTSVPGVLPPIPIDGRTYIDGGLRSAVNADLALPADVVVILEPLAHMFPRTRADRDLGSAREISVVPDATAVAAFGPDVFAVAALTPAFESGVRQSADAATSLKDVWPAR